jgi:hypothetical protein
LQPFKHSEVTSSAVRVPIGTTKPPMIGLAWTGGVAVHRQTGQGFHARRRQALARGNEQNAGFVFIFQCRFEELGGKIRVLPEPSNEVSSHEMLALRFMRFRSLIFVIVEVFQRPFSVCGLFSFVAATEKQRTVPADHLGRKSETAQREHPLSRFKSTKNGCGGPQRPENASP